MDVGEYIRNKQKKKENDSRAKSPENLNDAIGKYSAMNEEQLMQELFRVGKVSSGNVSADELDAFYANVRGFLTPEQSEKMRALIMQLKMQ